MRLILIRHGPTHEKCCLGWRDVPADLSNTARIEQVTTFLPKDAVVVSSDLLRARQTAEAICQSRRVLPVHAGVREFNFGDWDGLSFDKISQDYPDLSRLFWDQAGDIAPPNGESWNRVSDRVSHAIFEVCQQAKTAYQASCVVVVTHLGAILTQIAQAQGITPYQAMSHHIDYLSITEFEGHLSSERFVYKPYVNFHQGADAVSGSAEADGGAHTV